MIKEIVIGLVWLVVVQGLFEWLVHNIVLHKFSVHHKTNRAAKFFYYHWEHHKRCRINKDNVDIEYEDLFYRCKFSSMVIKELALLKIFSFLTFLTLWSAHPIASIMAVIGIWYYFVVHMLSHIKPFNKNKVVLFLFGHHTDHHLGKNQNKNWGLTTCLWDYVLRTRVK